MKLWTYGEMEDKIKLDLDLQDETFIKPNEMIGYMNEALNEGESEIMVLNQDYFLTKFFLPLVQGRTRYDLPYNIYANKIRSIQYANGAIIYTVPQYRRKNKFENIALTTQFGINDDYGYYLLNDYPGQAEIELLPASRETAILSQAGFFAPMILWYIRNCARVPLTGEFCNPEVIAPAQVNDAADEIQTYAGSQTRGNAQQGLPGAYPGSLAYVTGDKIRVEPGPGGTLPAPLAVNTDYYVIAMGSGLIRLATSLLNARAGAAIDLTTTGTVYFTLKVSATTSITRATVIDIPEFATFLIQWVKCRCMEKEGDPRLVDAAKTLAQQKQQMIDTLVVGIDDDDDTIQGDFTHYQESN